jgi:CheY-like chemotaxis protein
MESQERLLGRLVCVTCLNKMCVGQCKFVRRNEAKESGAQPMDTRSPKSNRLSGKEYMTTEKRIKGTEEPSPRTGVGPRQVILLVDDEPTLAKCVRQVLERTGYTVLVAMCAEEALKTINSPEHIDLLIADLCLPDKSGVALAAEFKKTRPDTPVLISSGMLPIESISGLGMLWKPFTPEELRTKVKAALFAQTRVSAA